MATHKPKVERLDVDYQKTSRILNPIFQSEPTSAMVDILTVESQLIWDSTIKKYKYFDGTNIKTLGEGGGVGGDFIPLSGTDMGAPLTGLVEATAGAGFYLVGVDDRSEVIFKSTFAGGVYDNFIRRYTQGAGTYDNPDFATFVGQQEDRTVIYAGDRSPYQYAQLDVTKDRVQFQSTDNYVSFSHSSGGGRALLNFDDINSGDTTYFLPAKIGDQVIAMVSDLAEIALSVDYVNKQLKNSDGTVVYDWDNGDLKDFDGVEAISLIQRAGYDTTGTQVFNWSGSSLQAAIAQTTAVDLDYVTFGFANENYVPLNGTAIGFPIAGDLEFKYDVLLKGDSSDPSVENTISLSQDTGGFPPSSIVIKSASTTDDLYSAVIVGQSDASFVTASDSGTEQRSASLNTSTGSLSLNASKSTVGGDPSDYGSLLTLDANGIGFNTDSTANTAYISTENVSGGEKTFLFPNESGTFALVETSIEVTVSELQSFIAGSTLIAGRQYLITNPQQGGQILVNATDVNQISNRADWFRDTNLTAFGWIRIATATTGDIIDGITVDGVNLFANPVTVDFNPISVATLVVDEINANTSTTGWKAIKIEEYVILESVVSGAVFNGLPVLGVSTTVTFDTIQDTIKGEDSGAMILDISYDLSNDRIIKCTDNLRGNSYSISQFWLDNYEADSDINDFRWGDDSYLLATIEDCQFKNVFCLDPATVWDTHISAASINGNVFTAGFGYVGLARNSFTYGSMLSNFFLLSGIVDSILNGTSITNNKGIIAISNCNLTSQGFNINSNKTFGDNGSISIYSISSNEGISPSISGNEAHGVTLEISNSLLNGRASIEDNIVGDDSGSYPAAVIIKLLELAGDSAASFGFSQNSIKGTGDVLILKNIRVRGKDNIIGNNDISITGAGEITIMDNIDISMDSFRMQSNIASSLSLCSFKNIYAHSSVPVAISNITLSALFNRIENISWEADNTINMRFTKSGFNGTTNNGLAGSPVTLGYLPNAKMYPVKVTYEGGAMAGAGSSFTVGIETDNASALMGTTSIAIANSILINNTPTPTKSTAINRRIYLTPSAANITAGNVELFVEFKQSRF